MVLSDIKPGLPILIIGPGPVGLFCVQIAKACGAAPIIVAGTDKDGQRFEAAKELGVDKIINVSNENASDINTNNTNGAGVPSIWYHVRGR